MFHAWLDTAARLAVAAVLFASAFGFGSEVRYQTVGAGFALAGGLALIAATLSDRPRT